MTLGKVIAIEIVEDRTADARCDEGFLRVKRYRARNRHRDGTVSCEYPIDVVDRVTVDAVAVCLYSRTTDGVEVLTRAGLRPAATFRKGHATVLPEGEDPPARRGGAAPRPPGRLRSTGHG